jgi:hypothetical protein
VWDPDGGELAGVTVEGGRIREIATAGSA